MDLLAQAQNFSAEDAEDAELLWRFFWLSLEIYPLRTQKTLNMGGLEDPFVETTFPLRLKYLDILNLFSAKDAKKNPKWWLRCRVPLSQHGSGIRKAWIRIALSQLYQQTNFKAHP